MYHATIALRTDNPSVTLTAYVPTDTTVKREAILILPGGGYAFCSPREGEPIALAFLAQGFAAFVLDYSLNEKALYPRPLADASLAMQHIKENADTYGIDPARVFAVGFSAGGHVCASLGNLWNVPELRKALPDMPAGINRPAGIILCYPVISAYVPGTHGGTIQLALGTDQPTDAQRDIFSIEKRVSGDTVPTFFMHTVEDRVVPVQNSLVLMEAMAEAKISFDARIYPHGPHGVSLATRETSLGRAAEEDDEISRWVADAVYWTRHM